MNKNNHIYIWVIFLISPFLALIESLKMPKENFSYNIIWLFSAFFGLTFAISSDSKSDIVRYLEEFNSWKTDGKNLSYLIENSYSKDGYEDIFFPLISMLCGKLGFSNIFFLAFLGLLFGYFYSRVYKALTTEIVLKNDFFLFLLITMFLLINPIWRGINGFRFGIASLIFIYIILKGFKKGYSTRHFIVMLSLVFIHFSMIFPIGLFLIFFFSNKLLKKEILFIIYSISFLFSSVNLDTLNEILKNYIPSFLIGKVDDYARETYVGEIAETLAQTNWYAIFFIKALFFACSVMLMYIYFRFKDLIKLNPRFDFLIKFLLFFSISVNFTGFIPSMSRMELISNMLTTFAFIILITKLKIKQTHLLRLKIVIVPMLLVYIVVQLRIGFDFLSTETILGNPLVAMFNLEKTPLIDLIK